MPKKPATIIIWVHQFGVRDSLFLQARIIAAILRRHDFDVQLISSQNSSLLTKLRGLRKAKEVYFLYGTFDLWGLAANLLGATIVFHNITPPHFFWRTSLPLALRSRAGTLLMKAFLRNRRFIAPSPFNAKVLLSTTGVSSDYCPNVVDIQGRIQNTGASVQGEPPKCFRLLFVGRIVENKNLIELLVCCAKIGQQLKTPVELTIIGDGNLHRDYYKRFQQAAERTEEEAHFRLQWIKEPVSDHDLQAKYTSSDLFVSTSTHEGFGLPLVESVLNGVPCLFFSNGGTESILGFDGMVPASSQHLFVARACELLLNPETKRGLFDKQLAAAQKFGTEAMERRVVASYGTPLAHG